MGTKWKENGKTTNKLEYCVLESKRTFWTNKLEYYVLESERTLRKFRKKKEKGLCKAPDEMRRGRKGGGGEEEVEHAEQYSTTLKMLLRKWQRYCVKMRLFSFVCVKRWRCKHFANVAKFAKFCQNFNLKIFS